MILKLNLTQSVVVAGFICGFFPVFFFAILKSDAGGGNHLCFDWDIGTELFSRSPDILC